MLQCCVRLSPVCLSVVNRAYVRLVRKLLNESTTVLGLGGMKVDYRTQYYGVITNARRRTVVNMKRYVGILQ